MVRINGEDKDTCQESISLEYLKDAGYRTGKDCGRTKSGNNSARSVRKCGDSGK